MNKTQIIALSSVLVLAAFIIYMSMSSRQPPVMPVDEEHSRFIDTETCQSCHGPDGIYPVEENHPLRTDCLDCHGMP